MHHIAVVMRNPRGMHYWGQGEPLSASVSVESYFVGLLGQP